ncbi:MAG: hypothetical protein JJ902_08425 [Roseibium sp.]|nr:hypothetical protein [Roseibium sp.]
MTLPDQLSAEMPVRKSARRLRWFIAAFEEQVKHTSNETGNRYSVDRDILAKVFVDWLKAFNAQKPTRSDDKPAYVGFAAGLMLRTLIKYAPARAVFQPGDVDESKPAYFWPEGFLYVTFCLNVRALVLESDFHGKQTASDLLNDQRTWWSFKENVDTDPSLAIAFLDLFAGDEPEWTTPGLFRSGRLKEIARGIDTKERLQFVD